MKFIKTFITTFTIEIICTLIHFCFLIGHISHELFYENEIRNNFFSINSVLPPEI